MITPHADYRANPNRAIQIQGVINADLVSRITPEILRLQHESREPITVYVDSPGGNVGAMEAILQILKSSDQDSAPACRIITVVANEAASAAADLLSSGDYALAYPTSAILYHGMRRQADSLPPLTAQITSLLGKLLRQSNDRYAMQLARKIEDRFSFRFMIARQDFDNLRAELAKPDFTDLDCFVELIGRRLSPEASKVWLRARERHRRYRSLFETILKKSKGDSGTLTRARIEARSIKAIVDFEVNANKKNKDWSFSQEGLDALADDFFLLNEYLSAASHERLRAWSIRFGKYLLAPADVTRIEAIADANQRAEELVNLVRPILEPLWSFFVALCHALQDGENSLTAWDAYWLGLVDEVVGTNLYCDRIFQEFTPDPSPVAASAATAPAAPAPPPPAAPAPAPDPAAGPKSGNPPTQG